MQEMKDFKKSKTKTSKTKTPKYFSRESFVIVFLQQFSFREKLLDDCLQKSQEYNWTNVEQFRPFSSLQLPVRLENPTISTKMGTFSLRSQLLTSAECLKGVKSSKNEGFQEVEN